MRTRTQALDTPDLMKRLLTLLVVVVVFVAIAWLHITYRWVGYTIGWSYRHVFPFALGLTLLLAAFNVREAALGGAFFYPLGLWLGEAIGDPILARQDARLAEQLQDPNYVQDWQPGHPGWYLSILIFLAGIVLGFILYRRRRTLARRDAPMHAVDIPTA